MGLGERSIRQNSAEIYENTTAGGDEICENTTASDEICEDATADADKKVKSIEGAGDYEVEQCFFGTLKLSEVIHPRKHAQTTSLFFHTKQMIKIGNFHKVITAYC